MVVGTTAYCKHRPHFVAECGQALNQSIVQQFKRAGNRQILTRYISPVARWRQNHANNERLCVVWFIINGQRGNSMRPRPYLNLAMECKISVHFHKIPSSKFNRKQFLRFRLISCTGAQGRSYLNRKYVGLGKRIKMRKVWEVETVHRPVTKEPCHKPRTFIFASILSAQRCHIWQPTLKAKCRVYPFIITRGFLAK
jgi:hypothetical protein